MWLVSGGGGDGGDLAALGVVDGPQIGAPPFEAWFEIVRPGAGPFVDFEGGGEGAEEDVVDLVKVLVEGGGFEAYGVWGVAEGVGVAFGFGRNWELLLFIGGGVVLVVLILDDEGLGGVVEVGAEELVEGELAAVDLVIVEGEAVMVFDGGARFLG